MFNLGKAPLWKFHLVAKSPTHHILFFTVHHIIFDGWSAGILMHAIYQKYSERVKHAVQFQPNINADLSFREFVNWHTSQMAAKAWEQDYLFWQQKLKDLPKPFFDIQHRKPELSKGQRYTWLVHASLLTKAKHFAKEHNTTLFAVLFAPYFLTLFNNSGQLDGQIATLHANRVRSPFDKLIGYMTNVLVVRAAIEKRLSLADFVMQVADSCRDAFNHCMYPFDEIIKRMDVRITHEDNPVFQCFFILQNWMETALNSNFQNSTSCRANIAESAKRDAVARASQTDEPTINQTIQIGFRELGSHSAKAVLSMNCVERHDDIECWIEYPVNLFDKEEIASMANSYNHFLNVILDEPLLKIANLLDKGILRKASKPLPAEADGFPGWPFDVSAKVELPVSASEIINIKEMSFIWQHGNTSLENLLVFIGLFVSKALQTESFALPVYVPSVKKQTEPMHANLLKIYGVDHPDACFFHGPVLAQHFKAFANSLLSNPLPLKKLHLLMPVQVDQLTAKCIATAGAVQAETVSVLDLFRKNVQRYPDAPAIVDNSVVVSYDELDRLSSSIAAKLLEKALPAGQPAGIMLDRSPLQVACVLAVLKAGMPYLPLDANQPGARLKAILGDAKPVCVLTNIMHHDAFDGYRGLIINPEALAAKDQQGLGQFAINPYEPAYIIYTSGSAGLPKGVVVQHLALSSFTLAAIQRYGIKHTDKILQFASFTFDAAVEETFCALCIGACLVLRNDTMISSMRAFMDELRRHEVTVLDLPTAFWSQMVRTLIEEERSFPPTVRLVIIGGEKAPGSTTGLWVKSFPDKPLLINTYGPTEATVVATSCYLHENQNEGTFAIGTALGDTFAVVTDKYLNPLPPGVTGELALAGPQLASGYLHDAANTNIKIVKPDQPFFNDLRFLSTGDKAFINSHDQLVFQRRIDKQMKIRGFRVELNEIDVFLTQNPEVSEAYTVFKKHHNSPRIISYVVVQEPESADLTSIAGHLKNNLPDYMLPAAIIPLRKFPLNANMKVDEKALPEPDFEDAEHIPELLTMEQEIVAEAFKETLKIKQCGSNSNFFDMGGDSLLALLCISELEKKTGVSLSIGVFYEHPVVSRLAELLKEHNDSKQSLGSHLPKEIVCLQNGSGNKPPLFTVYFDAANHYLPQLLDDDQGIYTFIPQGSDGEKITRKSVKEMAAFFVEIIEMNFRQQAVMLAGYSFGGLVALEMALILHSKKWNIETLLLVDTMAPNEWKRKAAPVSNIREKWKIIKNIMVSGFMIMLNKPVPRKRRNLYILYHWYVAAMLYLPVNAGFNQAITLIVSGRSLSDVPLLGWEHEAGFNIENHVIEGDHHSLVRSRDGVKKILELSGLDLR